MRATIPTLGLAAVSAMGILAPASSEAAARGGYRNACVCVAFRGEARSVPLVTVAATPALPGLRVFGEPPAEKVYVANELAGSVTVIDAATKQAIRNVVISYKVAGTPYEMVFNPRGVVVAPDGGSVWVTAPIPLSDCAGGEGDCAGPNLPPGALEEVVVLDPKTDTILGRIPVKSLDGNAVHLSRVVIDKDSRFAYITANGSSQIVRVDVQTRQIAGRVDLGANRDPQSVEICDDKLLIANGAGKSLSVVETSRGTAEEVPLGGVAIHAVCGPDARAAYVTLFDTREVVRYEFATGGITRIPMPESAVGPSQLRLSPDGRKLYVLDQGTLMNRKVSDKLYELDARTGAVQATITVGRSPRALVVSDDGKMAYTSNWYDSNISVVDLAARRVVASVATGVAPNGIGVWQNGGRLMP